MRRKLIKKVIENSLAESVARLVREEHQKVLDAWEDPVVSGEEKIHALRLYIKFLRSMLRLLKPLWKNVYKRENKRLRDLGRKFALVRDETVAASWLGKFLKKQPQALLKGALENALQGFEKETKDFQRPPEEIQECARLFQEVGRNFQELSKNGVSEKLLKKQLKKSWIKARKDMRNLEGGANTQYHSWRKSSKTLYFQLRLLGRLGVVGREAGGAVKKLHGLQSKLGDQHDLVMLRQALEKDPKRFGGKKSVKIATDFLTQKLRRFRKKCRKRGRKIFKNNPRKFKARRVS